MTLAYVLIALLAAATATLAVYAYLTKRAFVYYRNNHKFERHVDQANLWGALEDVEDRIHSIHERLEHVVVKTANVARVAAKKAPAKRAVKKASPKKK